jgi:predicted DNA-binding transcriptional regulator AlpA
MNDALTRVPPHRTLVDVKRAAAAIGLSHHTLNTMRVRGGGPPFIRVGARRVMYSLADISAWLDGRTRTSTSEHAA